MVWTAIRGAPTGESGGEQGAHAFPHKEDWASRVGLPEGCDEGRDVAHLVLKIQRDATPLGHGVAALPTKVEGVEGKSGYPLWQGVELFA